MTPGPRDSERNLVGPEMPVFPRGQSLTAVKAVCWVGGSKGVALWRELSLRGVSGGRNSQGDSQGRPRAKVSERAGERRGRMPAPASIQAGPGQPSPRTKMRGSENTSNSPQRNPTLAWPRGQLVQGSLLLPEAIGLAGTGPDLRCLP